DSPDALLARHQCTILEDVFLILCQTDCGEIKEKYSIKKKSESLKKASDSHDDQGDIYEPDAKAIDCASSSSASSEMSGSQGGGGGPKSIQKSGQRKSTLGLDWVRL